MPGLASNQVATKRALIAADLSRKTGLHTDYNESIGQSGLKTRFNSSLERG